MGPLPLPLVRGGREDPTQGSSRVGPVLGRGLGGCPGGCVSGPVWGGVGVRLFGVVRGDVVALLGAAGGVVVAVLGEPTRLSTTHEPKGYA